MNDGPRIIRAIVTDYGLLWRAAVHVSLKETGDG
jgi:hypothetical protein